MKEQQQIFTNFMNEFVKLTIEQKSTEIIEKQKLILTHLFKYAHDNGIEYDFLKGREIANIENNAKTNEDYLEIMMVYIENIEELIGIILSNK